MAWAIKFKASRSGLSCWAEYWLGWGRSAALIIATWRFKPLTREGIHVPGRLQTYCFRYGLPFTWRQLAASSGSRGQVKITNGCDERWRWRFRRVPKSPARCLKPLRLQRKTRHRHRSPRCKRRKANFSDLKPHTFWLIPTLFKFCIRRNLKCLQKDFLTSLRHSTKRPIQSAKVRRTYTKEWLRSRTSTSPSWRWWKTMTTRSSSIFTRPRTGISTECTGYRDLEAPKLRRMPRKG